MRQISVMFSQKVTSARGSVLLTVDLELNLDQVSGAYFHKYFALITHQSLRAQKTLYKRQGGCVVGV